MIAPVSLLERITGGMPSFKQIVVDEMAAGRTKTSTSFQTWR
jgi:hypothetical protein